MKKTTLNKLTNILASVMWCAMVAAPFFIKENVLPIMGMFLLGGLVAYYFKNSDAQALVKNYLKRFMYESK